MKWSPIIFILFFCACEEVAKVKDGTVLTTDPAPVVSDPIDEAPSPGVPKEDQPLPTDPGSEETPEKERPIDAVVSCALEKTYNEAKLSKKRLRTLKFVSDRLEQEFGERNWTTVTKSHFLAQVLHESSGLSGTVERIIGPTWRRLFEGESEVWNCSEYLDAINEDDDFFDNRYQYSKNSYRSKFRGRGLVQLTGCYNYLGFFYHLSAKQNGYLGKVDQHRTSFKYEENGEQVQVGMYCDERVLSKMEGEFEKESLEISPVEFLSTFEESADEVALPCLDRGVQELTSEKFVVDSSFWYFKKCETSEYTKNFINTDSDQAVARITECVHGRHKVYQEYQTIDCSKDQSNWRMDSYCNRRKLYKNLMVCFQSASVSFSR